MNLKTYAQKRKQLLEELNVEKNKIKCLRKHIKHVEQELEALDTVVLFKKQ